MAENYHVYPTQFYVLIIFKYFQIVSSVRISIFVFAKYSLIRFIRSNNSDSIFMYLSASFLIRMDYDS